MWIGRGIGISGSGMTLGSSGVVTAADQEPGTVILRAFLAKCEIEEDTDLRNRGHRKRGIIATSKVRAAITIANISPGDMSLLLCSWLSELSRL